MLYIDIPWRTYDFWRWIIETGFQVSTHEIICQSSEIAI
jgi:hypothetical protein